MTRRPLPSDVEALVPIGSIASWQHMATAVYRVHDEAQNLLYIGMTTGLKRRMAGHAQWSRWWSQRDSIQLDWHRTIWHARMAEIAAIHVEQPVFNKREKRPVRAPLKREFAEALEAVRTSPDPEAAVREAVARRLARTGTPGTLERHLIVGALDGSLNVPLASQKATA